MKKAVIETFKIQTIKEITAIIFLSFLLTNEIAIKFGNYQSSE